MDIGETGRNLNIFDKNGKFISKVSSKGRAKNEYLSFANVMFDDVNKELLIYSAYPSLNRNSAANDGVRFNYQKLSNQELRAYCGGLHSTTPINSLFEDITLIPLDSENGELLGETLYLSKDNDSYYVMDRRNKTLQRYSLDGKFKNLIGSEGRADNEYSNIVDCYVGSQINVLSSGRKVNNYTKDGGVVGLFLLVLIQMVLEL